MRLWSPTTMSSLARNADHFILIGRNYGSDESLAVARRRRNRRKEN